MSKEKSLVSAFSYVPVIEQFLPDKQIECVCAWDKMLYIGTTDGLVVYYSVVASPSPLGKTVYQSKLKARKQLDSDRKKRLQQLTLLPNMNRLLALVEGTLYLLDMNNLEVIGERLTKITCFCVDDGRSIYSSQCELVIAQLKKKSFSVYSLYNDRFNLSREVPLPDQPVAIARDGINVCAALSTVNFDAGRYVLVNLTDRNEIIELPFYSIGVTPIVKRTTKDEFLINTGDVGVIVSSDGIARRPSVEWRSKAPFSAAYYFPYVIIWSKETNNLHAFSLIDQRSKQSIPFKNGKYLGQFHNKLYAATSTGVYLLVPVPLKDQVTNLLKDCFVDEAILLAETIAAVDESKNPDKAEEYICEVKKQSAFIYFKQGQFSKVEALLLEGNVDPREVISKYEGLLTCTSPFIPLVDIPTAQELADSKQLSLKEAKKFLIRYLKEVRTTSLALGRKEEIDTALVKLLAEEYSPSLTHYMQNYDMFLNFDESKTAFENHQCYFALGLLYFYNGTVNSALEIWTRIYDKKLSDDLFPGFDYIVEFLTLYADNDMKLKYSSWVLNYDQVKGASIFIKQSDQDSSSPQLEPSVVLEKLSPYVEASLTYLEHLIYEKGSKEEMFHTRLGTFYLEKVLKLKSEGTSDSLLQSRKKLQKFLEESSFYRASVFLNRVQDTDLYSECAILYGKMDEHDKALNLLVHKLQDYDGAERYCSIYSKGCSRQQRQKIYQALLSAYLRPTDSSKPLLLKQALKLLNAHGGEFDASKVLEILPPQWEINTVSQFLVRSIRGTTNAARSAKIEHSLAKGENLQTTHRLLKLQKGPIKINESRVCPVCQSAFTDGTVFVHYPNGIVTHLKCGRNKTICPITGTWFSD